MIASIFNSKTKYMFLQQIFLVVHFNTHKVLQNYATFYLTFNPNYLYI